MFCHWVESPLIFRIQCLLGTFIRVANYLGKALEILSMEFRQIALDDRKVSGGHKRDLLQ